MRLNAGLYCSRCTNPSIWPNNSLASTPIYGGKLIVGAALGYREVEFKAFGTNARARAKRFEENLIALKRLWTEDAVDMVEYAFRTRWRETCLPKPLQKPTPIWIGANADPAIRRAARMGDCWYIPPHNAISTIIRQMDVYKRALDAAGKPFPVELPMRRECSLRRPKARRSVSTGHILPRNTNYTDWGQSDQLPDDDSKLEQTFGDLVGDRFLSIPRWSVNRSSSAQADRHEPSYYEHGLGGNAATGDLGFTCACSPKRWRRKCGTASDVKHPNARSSGYAAFR